MKLKKLLLPNERIITKAKQGRVRPGGSLITPSTIIVTNKRIMIIDPSKLGLQKRIQSYPISAIFGVELINGVTGSTISLKVPGAEGVEELTAVTALPKGKAREIYNLILEQIEGVKVGYRGTKDSIRGRDKPSGKKSKKRPKSSK